MIYGIKFTKNDAGKITVTCRDIPECTFEADTEEEAIANTEQALPGALFFFYRKKKLPFPMPSAIQSGEIPGRIPVRLQAKMLFWNFMLSKGMKITDVAKQLGISHSEASRLVDITRDSASVDTIEEALHKLGENLTLMIK